MPTEQRTAYAAGYSRRVMAALGLAAILSAPPAIASEPNVVVTIKPIHSLVAQVMDGVGTPALLVKGSASPHTFSMRPSDARAINKADVFIRVSEDVEPFTAKIVAALPKSVRLVSLSDVSGVKLLSRRIGGTFEAHVHGPDDHHDDHAGHKNNADDDTHHGEDAHGKSDGHIWLDPDNAKAIVEAVTQTLVTAYPMQAVRLKANAVTALARIDTLAESVNADLAGARGKPFVVFHDAYQYFEKRFGIEAVGSVTVSPEVQPSAKRLSELRAKLTGLNTVCVFAEPGFKPNLVAAITEGTKAKSGTLDPEGQSLQPGPELYGALIRGIASNLKACLAPTS